MELLCPAGDRAALVAAVQNGADAVYFGTRAFNARRSANNFEGEGLLDALIEYFTSEGGLFCIPTHTWSSLGRTDVEYTLDMQSNETCVGTLPNIAAARHSWPLAGS